MKVKEFLDQNGITYQEFNVAEDQAALNEMLSLTHQNAVPQIYIDGEMIIGFQEDLLRQKLGLN